MKFSILSLALCTSNIFAHHGPTEPYDVFGHVGFAGCFEDCIACFSADSQETYPFVSCCWHHKSNDCESCEIYQVTHCAKIQGLFDLQGCLHCAFQEVSWPAKQTVIDRCYQLHPWQVWHQDCARCCRREARREASCSKASCQANRGCKALGKALGKARSKANCCKASFDGGPDVCESSAIGHVYCQCSIDQGRTDSAKV